MKKFFAEFKTFITRGNVVDMAVGVIVGSSFTAIVNGMSNFILKPLTNWLLALIFKADSLKELYTMLKPAYLADEAGNLTAELDMANSIYIDWGSFINAIINFFLIALVLFTIVKIINKVREDHDALEAKLEGRKLTKADKKELKARGIKRSDRLAVAAYLEEKKEQARIEVLAKEEAEKQKALDNPSTEELLKQILAELKNKA